MSLPLSITVDRINVDERYSLGEEGPWPCERPNTLGELYRSLVKEYGRCTSHVYIEGTDGKRAVKIPADVGESPDAITEWLDGERELWEVEAQP